MESVPQTAVDSDMVPIPVVKPDVIPEELPPPLFTVRPKSQWVMTENEIKLSVRVMATSKPDVKWMKDGHCITYNGLYNIIILNI